MSFGNRLLLFLVLLASSLSLIWLHLFAVDSSVSRSLQSQEELEQTIKQALATYTINQADIQHAQKEGFQRQLYTLRLDSHGLCVPDLILDYQNQLQDKGVELHGRINLTENFWNVHFIYKQEIISSLHIYVKRRP
jgi:hypothetical protein